MPGQWHSERARSLRHEATEAERKLWLHLRNRHTGGYKFRRQQVIGPYIVDFFCYDALLVVEVDGSQHFEQEHKSRDDERSIYLQSLGMRVLRDDERSIYLQSLGMRVLRFDNRQVLTETTAVVETILQVLEAPRNPGL